MVSETFKLKKVKGLNGDARILAEKLDAKFDEFKGYIQEEFREIKESNGVIYKRLDQHGTKITRNTTLIGVGSAIVVILVTIFIKITFG